MTPAAQPARLHALADAAEHEAGSAARKADEALAAMLGITPAGLKARYAGILAGPPVSDEGLARVAALFGLVVVPAQSGQVAS